MLGRHTQVPPYRPRQLTPTDLDVWSQCTDTLLAATGIPSCDLEFTHAVGDTIRTKFHPPAFGVRINKTPMNHIHPLYWLALRN